MTGAGVGAWGKYTGYCLIFVFEPLSASVKKKIALSA